MPASGSGLLAGRVPRRAVVDLGSAPGGATGARFVATADQTEFIVKSPSASARAGPFVAPNELIGVQLAAMLEIPVLPWEFILLPGGELGFGSLRLDSADFAPMSDSIAAQLTNSTEFCAVAVLDLWICNRDRHGGNLLARRNRHNQGGGYSMLANEHSHALLHGVADPAQLAATYATVPPAQFFRCSQLLGGVVPCSRLGDTLDLVESLPRETVEGVVAGVPDAWMKQSAREHVARFLTDRARNIRVLMQGCVPLFPSLNGITL